MLAVWWVEPCDVSFSFVFLFVVLVGQTSSLIYQATVTRHDNNKEESYIGLTGTGHIQRLWKMHFRSCVILHNYQPIAKRYENSHYPIIYECVYTAG